MIMCSGIKIWKVVAKNTLAVADTSDSNPNVSVLDLIADVYMQEKKQALRADERYPSLPAILLLRVMGNIENPNCLKVAEMLLSKEAKRETTNCAVKFFHLFTDVK